MKISCVYSSFVPKAEEFYNFLAKNYSFVSEEEADVIVCLGGDGFMLHCLHNYIHLNKPLYGTNCGSRGFLLNQQNNSFDLIYSIKNSLEFKLNPLMATFKDINNKISNAFAFNEISFLRSKPKSSHLGINIDNNTRIKKLIGDGLLISTPVGSTAYNRSCGGSILSIYSNLLAITPINPLNPLNWKGTTVSCKSSIEINNLSLDRPVNMFADCYEYGNIISASINSFKEKYVSVLFNKDDDLENKIIKHQFNQ